MNSNISTVSVLIRAFSSARLALTFLALLFGFSFHQAAAQCTVVNGIVTSSGPLGICEGEAVTLSATSGYLSYNWNNGSTTESITVSTTGSYNVTVTDNSGCYESETVNVVVNQHPMPMLTGNLIVCNGAPALLNAGEGYLAYLWSTGETTQTIEVSSSSEFSVTVVDSNGCIGSTGTFITTSAFLEPTITGFVVCSSPNGLDAGSGYASYLWSTGETTQTIPFIPFEEYSVTVTNDLGCSGADTVIGLEVPPPPISITGDTVVCVGGVAELNANPFGLPFIWSTGETTNKIYATQPGVYSIQVFEGFCTFETGINVLPAGAINASIVGNDFTCPGIATTLSLNDTFDSYAWYDGSTSSTLDINGPGVYNVTVINGECKAVAEKIVVMDEPQISIEVFPATGAASNGELQTTITGGSAPYSFLWSNGSTTESLTGIPSGVYSVTVTSATGCSGTLDVFLSSISAPPPSVTFIITDATCGQANGAVDLNVTDGMPPYTFAWSNGATTEDLANVPAGTYSVTVTDADGNNAIDAATVGGATAPSIALEPNDASCGLSNGSISSSLSGGAAPFTYEWSNGATTTTIGSLPAGSYSLTVNDTNNCTATADTTLLDSPAPSVAFTVTDEICGNANGTIATAINNGTPPFTTIWSNDSASQNINGLVAGDYTISIFDAEGCSTSGTTTVNNTPGPTVTLTISNSTCGDANGSLASTVTDGTAPFTYAWSNFETSADLNNVGAGTYTLTVTDSNNCSDTASATVNDIPAPSLSTASVNTSCGNANGSIDLMVTGATAPYTFAWSNAASSEDLTNLAGGTYSITVTDDNGCTVVANALVDSSEEASVSLTSTNTTCGLSNGAISTTINSGTGPFTYAWNNAATTANLSNLSAGTYTVTVTDADGCTDVQSANVGTSTSPSASANVTDATCGLNNGSVTVSVGGGTAPYSFAWSNAASTQNLNNIAGGTYTVMVTDAANCTTSATATVGTTTPPTVTNTVTNASCGNSNGTVNVSVTGGVTPYTFVWNNGTTSEDLGAIGAGTYTVTVTDNIGCTATSTATVTSSPAVSVSLTTDDAACGLNTGSVTSSVTGGTGPFVYAWSNGATTPNLSNVGASGFTLTVTDATGCTATASASVSNTGGPLLTLTPTPATCGLSNGSIAVTVSGGSAPFTYSWSNGATSQNLANVAAGPYTVSVTDANNCIAVSSVTLSGSTPPTINVNSPTVCAGQSTSLTASGAATYTWAPSTGLGATTGATVSASPTVTTTYTVTGTGANGCTATATATVSVNTPPTVTVTPANDTICLGESVLLFASGGVSYTWVPNSGLSATTGASVTATPTVSSTYTVTATNADNCTAQISAVVFLSGTPAAAATATASTCNASNGTVSLSVSGGALPYTFAWSNGATSQNLSGLGAGTYSVTVTSSHGCTTIASATVGSVASPAVNATASTATCGLSNGSATAAVAGGVGPFVYQWSNGGTAASISGLTGGTYTVTVTDANGCTDSASAAVTAVPGLSLTLTANTTTCGSANGSVSTNVAGGAPPYSFVWSNGATTQNITGLAPGTYSVTVTGSLGCTAAHSATITPSVAPAVTASNVADATCGSNNGSIDISVSGGTPPYTFQWSNSGTSQNLTGLAAGTYTVTVTDANNCTATLTVSVSSVGGPTITTAVLDAGCNNNDGSVSVGVVGGTAPYNFEWSNGATVQNLNNLSAGSYSLIVTDANNCVSAVTVTVGSTPPPVLSGFAINASCGEDNGFVDITVSGGSVPYTFDWNNGSTDEDVSGLTQGTYQVTVTDAEGCSATATFDVQASPLPDILFDVTDAACGQFTGFVNASVNGGLAPFLFVWSNGQMTEDLNGVAGGIYTLTVTDDEGCTVAEDVTVGDVPGPQISGLVTNATCANADGTVELDVTGGTPPYTVNWSNGTTDEDLVNVIPGTYTVTVLDANFCFTEQTFNVNPGDVPYATYTTTEVLCGLANGAIDITPGGGLPPYSYNWNNGATTQDLSALPVGLYSFTVTDALGCTFVQSALVTSSDPSPQLAAETDSSSCGNANGSIEVTITGGEAPFNYLWSNGATVEDLFGLQSGNYILTVTDNNGCQDALLVTVGNISAPSAGAVVTAATCGNANGAVNLSVTNGSGPYEFMWSNGATTEDLANINGGAFGVTVSDAGGCSTTLNVNVGQTPAVTMGSVTGPNMVNANSINTYSVSQQPGMLYNWTANGGSVVTGQGTNLVQVQWSNAGTYDLIATVTDAVTDCFASDTLSVSVITGIDALNGISGLTVYPNPTSGAFAVRFDAAISIDVELSMYAVDGRLVHAQSFKTKPGVNTVSMNSENLAAGVYLLELRDGNSSRHVKLILER